MKNTKILSLALAAFMLTGCNLFNKGSLKAEWKEYSFKEEDIIDSFEKNILISKVTANLSKFSEFDFNYSVYTLQSGGVEATVKADQKCIAYTDNAIERTTKYEMTTKQGGVASITAYRQKLSSFVTSHTEEGVTTYYQLTMNSQDDVPSYSKSVYDPTNDFYRQYINVISLPSSANYWKVKDGYQVISSSYNETHTDESFGVGVREKVTIEKTQTVYNINKDFQLVSGYMYGETSSNVDLDGIWHDKAIVLTKTEAIAQVKYKTRGDYLDRGFFLDLFNRPMFISFYIDTYGDNFDGTNHTSAVFPSSQVEHKFTRTGGSRYHVSYYAHLGFSDTCNGLRIRVSGSYYENFYDNSPKNSYVELLLNPLSTKFSFSTSDTGEGDHYRYNTIADGSSEVTFRLEFDVYIGTYGSSHSLVEENMTATLIG